jgi:monofunctional biosynthetic peptidoglycan transglycosylase
MPRVLRRAARATGWLAAAGVAWLVAVWPPPGWYRTHWPAETAFQAMRRGEPGVRARAAADSAARRPLLEGWGAGHPPRTWRLYHPVPLATLPAALAAAAMAGEDQRFRDHHGIDWVNLRRALGYPRDRFAWGAPRDRADLRRALARAWARRAALRGASTITQQLAKNLYLSPSRNPLRKLKEAVTAYRLEQALGKDRILELYLNVAEMGPEIWGVEGASERYFGIPAARLSRDEAAQLAALLPFPLRSNPLTRPGRMFSRQRLILRKLGGEEVTLPPVPEEEAAPPPSDTLAPPPDSLPMPADSLLPLLPDSSASDTVPARDSSVAPPPPTAAPSTS